MEGFMELIKKLDGFEFVQAYADDGDHLIGGKGDTCWYIILRNGKVKESYIGSFRDGKWHDRFIKGEGRKAAEKEMPAGTTIELVEKNAFIYQDEEWAQKKTPRVIEDSHPHYHYVYGFGDKALDVSQQYGVTIAYSDIKDLSVGFHLRDLQTGKDVELP